MYMEAYCVRCKKKQEIKDPEQKTLTNGRLALAGVCPVCQTKMLRFLPKTEQGPKENEV